MTEGFIRAQINQSGVITSSVRQVNQKINKGFNSAEYVLSDVALHVRSGDVHIKIYMHTIPEDVFIFTCKYQLFTTNCVLSYS